MAKTPRVAFYETNSLEEHVRLIQEQVDKSLADPETRKLALDVAQHKVHAYAEEDGMRVPMVSAWGNHYRLGLRLPHHTPGDPLSEIRAFWNFVVLNIEYTPDPPEYDLFCTLRVMLDAHAGDCDDMTIAFGTLLRAVGFQNVWARVISQSGSHWEHVYAIVGVPKHGSPAEIVALDPTVKNAKPGWEFRNGRTKKQDFRL